MRRILLKLSGEALAGEKKTGFDEPTVRKVALQVKELVDDGIQVGIVIGGGNFWRGRTSENIDRTKADQIGMLATIMNAIYVADFLRQEGVGAVVQTPFKCGTMTEEFSKDSALKHLENKEVVIFAGGLGHPMFSTDTITALRGAELEVDGLFFAKNVDGVYDDDPAKNPNAKKIEEIKCGDIIKNNLRVIDLTAATLCFDNRIPVVIFGLNDENSIVRAVGGEKIGTVVTVG